MIILYYPQNTPPRMGRLPLSILALGAVLDGRHEYVIVDGNVTRRAYEAVSDHVRLARGRALVAVSVMPGTQMLNAIHHCKALKKTYQDVTIVWGGYFPSMHTESVLNSAHVDYVIRGQGERTLLAFVESWLSNKQGLQIQNLSYRLNGQFVHNRDFPIYDPNDRPLLPYERVRMNDYALETFVGRRTFCHETSVGCPHKCNFCGVVDVFHSRWKAEAPDRTAEIMSHLKNKYGMDGIEFHDSDFFVSEKRVALLAEKLIDLKLDWWGEGRVDTLLDYSPETWKLMQRSGLRMIFLGAESGLDETLKLMDKGGVTRQKIKAVAALCKEYNVQSEFSFVMGGNPIHTEEDIDATIDLIYEIENVNPKSQMHPFVYTPVPFGTIYDTAVEGGLHYPKDLDSWASHEWSQYTLRQNPHTPWLTARLLKKIVNFRAVHQSYFPKTNDRNIPRWKMTLLKLFSSWRYKNRFFYAAYEIRFLLKVLLNSAPAREGF